MKKPVRLLTASLLGCLLLLSASCGRASGETAAAVSGAGSVPAGDVSSLSGSASEAGETVSVSSVKGEVITAPSHLAGGNAEASDDALSRPGVCYRNTYFGIRFSLPEGWSFASGDQLANMNQAAASGQAAEGAGTVEKDAAVWFDMYAASNDEQQNVNITIQDIGEEYGSSADTEALVDSSLEELRASLLTQGVTDLALKKDTAVFLGSSSPAIVVDGVISGIPFHEIQVYCRNGSYILCATAVSYTEDLTASLLDSFSPI